MSEPRAAPKTPPRDDPGRGLVLFGSALLALGGTIYLPGGLLLGATLGAGLQLDPSWPWLAGLAGNALAAVLFAAGGALLALLCVAAAGACVARWPHAPWVLGAAAAALLVTANVPLALVAFSLAYAAAPTPTPAPAPPTPA